MIILKSLTSCAIIIRVKSNMLKSKNKKSLHYAWYVCIGCACLLFCTSGLSINAFTVYQPYILSVNGFTNTQTSSIITIRSLFAFFSMFLTGAYYKKLSLRKGMGIAGLFTALGFVLFGISESYLLYCIGAASVGIGYGFGTMVPIAIVLEHWFIEKRTLALSICSGITGLSTFGIPSLITGMVEGLGLKITFITEAAAIVLLTAICFLLVRDTPTDKKILPYGESESLKTANSVPGGSLLKKMHWFFLVSMLLLIGAMTNVGYSHLAILVTSEGFSSHLSALAITVSGISLTASKFIYGWVTEKTGTYKSNTLFGIILTIGIILCCFSGTNEVVMITAMCLYGSGLALTTVGLTAWVGDFCSGKEYDKTVRFFQIGYAAGSFVFSSLPGILADKFNGSYVPAYIFFVICTLYVIFTIQWVYKSTGKNKCKQL